MSGTDRMGIPGAGGPRYERCEHCHHWWVEAKQQVVQTPQGNVPLAQLIKQGQMKPGTPVLTIAPCTYWPTWASATIDHWCGQYKARAPGANGG